MVHSGVVEGAGACGMAGRATFVIEDTGVAGASAGGMMLSWLGGIRKGAGGCWGMYGFGGKGGPSCV